MLEISGVANVSANMKVATQMFDLSKYWLYDDFNCKFDCIVHHIVLSPGNYAELALRSAQLA